MSVGSLTPSSSTPKVVRFQLNYNLKSLLLSFANEKDRNSYEKLLCHIRDLGQEIRDDDLTQLLREARGCISIIDANFRLFVKLVLILRWAHRSDEVVQEYQGFLQDLCSAHNYYTKVVIDHLITYFNTDTSDWNDDEPGSSSKRSFKNLHNVIKSILAGIPMSRELLINSIRNNYPYIKRPSSEQACYAYNLLNIVQYEQSMRYDVLKIIIDRLIVLDVHCPQNELLKDKENTMMDVDDDGIFPMEDTTVSESKSQLSDSLDISLILVYKFLWTETHDSEGQLVWDKTKSIFQDLIKIFDEVILPTHATSHVQFIIFYFLAFKQILGQLFIQALWKKVSNVNIPPVIRQAAVCYMASFMARATYVPLVVVKDTITEMSRWIHSYIDNEDSSGCAIQDTKVHGVFYTTCQSLFYVIAFRHKDLIQNKGLNHLQSLGLSKIVTCRLNPLRVCLPVVVSNFAAIARSYQLAYCYSIMERNSRSTLPTVHRDSAGLVSGLVSQVHLDTFFPFDPYLLKRSKTFIDKLYREYTGPNDEKGASHTASKDEDEDDFLDSNTPTADTHAALNAFSYGTSPGFLQINS